MINAGSFSIYDIFKPIQEESWFICKWFESQNNTVSPGLHLHSDSSLSEEEVSKLISSDIDIIQSAPFGVFAQFLHPTGLVVQVTKVPSYLRMADSCKKKPSLKDRVLEIIGL